MKFRLLLVLLVCGVSSLHGQTGAEFISEAQRAYMRGDLETAKTKFKMALEIQPGNATALNYLRMIATQEKKSGVGGELEKQVRGVQLETVKLKDATLRDALEFLKQQAAKKSVNVSFVTELPPEMLAKPVSLDLANVPLTEALRYLCELTGTRYTIEKFAIVIRPLESTR